jgi:hypothetical protein
MVVLPFSPRPRRAIQIARLGGNLEQVNGTPREYVRARRKIFANPLTAQEKTQL